MNEAIEQAWRDFVATDSRLRQFDDDTLEGVKNVFVVGCVVGCRIGADLCEKQLMGDLRRKRCVPLNN